MKSVFDGKTKGVVRDKVNQVLLAAWKDELLE